MRVPPIGLALYVRIGPLSRKRASTTPTISSARPLRPRDGGRYLNHLVQLRRVWYENSTPISPPTSSKRSECVVCFVDFSAESINQFYNLNSVPPEPFDWLYEQPDYLEVIRVLTNGRGEWKLNSEGHAVHFKAKHLAYIPNVWHHFITSRLILTTNVCKVTACSTTPLSRIYHLMLRRLSRMPSSVTGTQK